MQAASRKVIGSLSLLAGVTFVLFLFSYFDSGVVHIRQKAFAVYSSDENVITSQHRLASKLLLKRNENEENEAQQYIHERIAQVCQFFGSKLQIESSHYRQQFMVDAKHKVAYCRHGKVGTTTWMRHFIKLLPEDLQPKYESFNSNQLHDHLPSKFRNKKIYNFPDDFFTFSFVRHPYDRLVSAYKDKFLNAQDPGYAFRSKLVLESYGSITFENFLLFVIEDLSRFNNCQKVGKRKCHQIDVHWRPYYQRCAYCDINYDYIGRMETFNADVAEIIQRANLTSFIKMEEASLQSHTTAPKRSSFEHLKFDSKGDIKSSPIAGEYFADVDESVRRQLHELYLPDFELFQYSAGD